MPGSIYKKATQKKKSLLVIAYWDDDKNLQSDFQSRLNHNPKRSGSKRMR
jgi:hypothetical protein